MNDPILIFQKKHTNRILLLSSVFVLSFIALGLGVYVIMNAANDITAAHRDRVRIMTDLNAIAALSGQKKPAEDMIPALGEILPNQIDIPTKIIPTIKALAAANNVRSSVSLDATAGTSSGSAAIVNVPITIQAQGSLSNLASFISKLEALKNVVVIMSWNVSGIGTGQFGLSASASILANANQ